MGIVTIILTAIGLAMDAFTVSIAKGISLKKVTIQGALKVGLFFGAFQAIMPLLGWLFGLSFEKYITAFDHWIALILLGLIGGKMLLEGIKKDEDEEEEDEVDPLNNRSLTLLAVATSIDALAVGISFAFLEVNITLAILAIGMITFALSALGVLIGKTVGPFLKNYAEIIGGIVLIFIGVSIFLEHTQLLSMIF